MNEIERTGKISEPIEVQKLSNGNMKLQMDITDGLQQKGWG